MNCSLFRPFQLCPRDQTDTWTVWGGVVRMGKLPTSWPQFTESLRQRKLPAPVRPRGRNQDPWKELGITSKDFNPLFTAV